MPAEAAIVEVERYDHAAADDEALEESLAMKSSYVGPAMIVMRLNATRPARDVRASLRSMPCAALGREAASVD